LPEIDLTESFRRRAFLRLVRAQAKLAPVRAAVLMRFAALA
jgi:hypothetical protein